uniref:Uncharacterized protein n=1 Tax=Aegilops tauschii TaxID=37682 RepID=R7W935_AEGTA
MAECSLATLGGQYRGGWTQSSAKRSPRNISIRMSKRNGKRLLDKSTSSDPNDTRNEVMAKLSEALEANDSLIEPAFMKWIEEEQALENGRIDEKLMMVISRKIKEDNWILKRFHRLGKVELYLDLLFFIRFGSARSDSYFDTKFLAENGARILEDLVIFLADVIASIYLEIMSVDGDMPTKVVGSSLALCSLSIRELQKQRNEQFDTVKS